MTSRLSAALARTGRLPGGPSYDPSGLRTGIVHLGIGAFHRAHQAALTDRATDLLDAGWGIVGVTQRSRRVLDQLAPQDALYTVEYRDGAARPATQVVGVVREVLFAGERPDDVTARLAAPATRIVSTTVTEKGYAADLTRRRLHVEDAAVAADLRDDHPHRSVVGQLMAGFAARAAAGRDGVTVLCCDNVVRGGQLLDRLCHDFADGWASGRAADTQAWIDTHVRFPDTLVDRVVPATTDADRAALRDRLGYDDEGLVVAEPFALWVIQDSFAAGHPAWPDEVRLVDDVGPWSAAKLRLLNGAHSLLAYLGLLAGFDTVGAVLRDADFGALLDGWLAEAGRSLGDGGAASADIAAYRTAVPARLRNPGIAHQLTQIAADGSAKLPARVVPVARELPAGEARLSALALAGWLRYLQVRPAGLVDDPLAERLAPAVDAPDPKEVVEAVFGVDGVLPLDASDGGTSDTYGALLKTTSDWLAALRRDDPADVVARAAGAAQEVR